jgi:hypothetical protein
MPSEEVPGDTADRARAAAATVASPACHLEVAEALAAEVAVASVAVEAAAAGRRLDRRKKRIHRRHI